MTQSHEVFGHTIESALGVISELCSSHSDTECLCIEQVHAQSDLTIR